MQAFWQPDTLDSALSIRKSHPEAVPLAGGTDLFVKFRKTGAPDPLLDLSRVACLQAICAESEGRKESEIHIGACVTFQALMAHPVGERFPALQKALRGIGSPQIRNRGTIGGSLCNASPAADLTPLWTVLDATVEAARINDAGAVETRRIPVERFILGMGKTALLPDELVTKLIFMPYRGRVSYEKVGRRDALSIARLSVAVALTFESGRVADARISAGAITNAPMRATAAEAYLLGKSLLPAEIEQAASLCADAYMDESHWRPSYTYKRPALCRIVCDLLTEAGKERCAG